MPDDVREIWAEQRLAPFNVHFDEVILDEIVDEAKPFVGRKLAVGKFGVAVRVTMLAMKIASLREAKRHLGWCYEKPSHVDAPNPFNISSRKSHCPGMLARCICFGSAGGSNLALIGISRNRILAVNPSHPSLGSSGKPALRRANGGDLRVDESKQGRGNSGYLT
jgi:hypothetical protein